MHYMKIFLVVSLLFPILNSQPCYASKNANLTFIVVDEDGTPIEDARVGVGFIVDYGKDYGIIEHTNSKGIALIDGRSAINSVGYTITTPGYYKSTGAYNYQGLKSGSWVPLNPEIHVILRKVENPVPMYARNTKFAADKKKEVPVLDKYVGFDLVVFDWVSPYGNGVQPDFLFKVEKEYQDKKNFKASMDIKFSNKFDGVISHTESTRFGSEFALPRYAPDAGYKDNLLFEINRKGSAIQRSVDYYKKNNNYVFRIRSKETNGQHSKSIYGKIVGPISFDPVFSKTAYISFKYYLNPDYTRNLEFDPKRNLFDELPPLEQVGI